MKVLEVDQWTSTGNVTDFTMDDFELENVHGGDSEAIRKIFGGSSRVIEVSENASPSIGNVWFRTDPNTGKLVYYKANYDSSD